MIKILSAEQIRQADAYTIKHEPVSSFDLMERAASGCYEWIKDYIQRTSGLKDPIIKVVCGTGNNGGDGLVIARKLIESNFNVQLVILRLGKGTDDFLKNLALLDNEASTYVNPEDFNSFQFDHCHYLVDCIFGTGLTRPVQGKLAVLFSKINDLDCQVVSVDLPSGLYADIHTEGAVIRSDHVLSFEVPKLAFFTAENEVYLKHFHLIPIGLDSNFISELESPYQLVNRDYISKILKRRNAFDHKGRFGHAALICGEKGKWGATILAARACLRSGVGKLSVYCDEEALPVIQESVPEAMCFSDMKDFEKVSFEALGIGPGLGTSREAERALSDILNAWNKEVVLDADALNILSLNTNLWDKILPESILTPHPGEFKRLTGSWNNDFDKLDNQRKLSVDRNVVVLLKGRYTSISNVEGNVCFNPTGNPGMATAGSGDVLTGIITGFKAQGYTSTESAILGAWLHGFSGDMALAHLSEESIIASDLINYLPDAFNAVRS